MRVLITGGAGFVGRRFARRLLDDGHHVIVVDDLSAGVLPGYWAFQAKDVSKFTFKDWNVREAFKAYPATSFDLIIHCAAVVGGRLRIDGDPLAVATDLAIDSYFFNWLAQSKTKAKVIYFSSSAVYPIELQTRDQNCALAESMVNFSGTRIALPDMTYGWAKLTGEYLAQFAAKNYGIDVVIYRPFSGYGEDQAFDYPFPSIIRHAVNGEDPIVVWGSGSQLRDFIYIEDVIDAVMTTKDKMQPGEVLNLGSGQGVSFFELAEMANPNVEIGNDLSKPEGVFARVADTAKLSQWYRPTTSLVEGIKKVAAHMERLTGQKG